MLEPFEHKEPVPKDRLFVFGEYFEKKKYSFEVRSIKSASLWGIIFHRNGFIPWPLLFIYQYIASSRRILFTLVIGGFRQCHRKRHLLAVSFHYNCDLIASGVALDDLLKLRAAFNSSAIYRYDPVACLHTG